MLTCFLNRYRLRNKKINATVRTFPLLNKVGVNNTVTTTAGNVISVIGSTETSGKIPSSNGISNVENSVSQLIPRSTDSTLRALETVKKVGKVGTNGQNATGPSAESVTEK
jgi:RING finger/CCCH-type zinc finger protein